MTLRQLASRKAAYTRHLGPDDPLTLEAAAALRTALLERAISDATQGAPPLSEAEKAALVALLLGA